MSGEVCSVTASSHACGALLETGDLRWSSKFEGMWCKFTNNGLQLVRDLAIPIVISDADCAVLHPN